MSTCCNPRLAPGLLTAPLLSGCCCVGGNHWLLDGANGESDKEHGSAKIETAVPPVDILPLPTPGAIPSNATGKATSPAGNGVNGTVDHPDGDAPTPFPLRPNPQADSQPPEPTALKSPANRNMERPQPPLPSASVPPLATAPADPPSVAVEFASPVANRLFYGAKSLAGSGTAAGERVASGHRVRAADPSQDAEPRSSATPGILTTGGIVGMVAGTVALAVLGGVAIGVCNSRRGRQGQPEPTSTDSDIPAGQS